MLETMTNDDRDDHRPAPIKADGADRAARDQDEQAGAAPDPEPVGSPMTGAAARDLDRD